MILRNKYIRNQLEATIYFVLAEKGNMFWVGRDEITGMQLGFQLKEEAQAFCDEKQRLFPENFYYVESVYVK